MENCRITEETIAAFAGTLRREEKSQGTIEKYLRDARAFSAWLAGAPVTKRLAAAWKAALLAEGLAPATVNAKLAAVNRLFTCMGRPECRVKPLRIQRKLFRDESRELTKAEYERLVSAAETLGRERLALLLEAIWPPASGCRRSGISPWRPPGGGSPRSGSRARSAPSCCPAGCAGSC